MASGVTLSRTLLIWAIGMKTLLYDIYNLFYKKTINIPTNMHFYISMY
jgi:hypothetical protein